VQRYLPRRLSAKLYLSVLVFLVVLAVATAALVLFGFRRTQTNATSQTRQALDDQQRQTLLHLSQAQASFGQLLVEQAVLKGQNAAAYFARAATDAVEPSADPASLVRAADGRMFDASGGRVTDVWVPASVTLDEATAARVRESAAFDALFPSLFGTRSAVLGTNDTLGVSYTDDRGITRYFPANGFSQRAPADIDDALREAIDALGPARNPTRRTLWTTPYVDPARGGSIVTARTPVYVGSDYRGFVAVDLSVPSLLAQADAIRVTEHGYAFVIDRDGRLMPSARAGDVQAALDAAGEDGPMAAVLGAMRRGETGVQQTRIAGEEVLVSYAGLGEFGGSLALVAPLSDVRGPVAGITDEINASGNRTVAFTLAVMAGFFVLALAGTTWLTRRLFLLPIEGLVRGTRSVAAGDLEWQIPVESDDELGQLADSFNMMTAEIRQRDATLREREEQYRSIFESTNDGIIITARDGTVVAANRATCEMHGYALDEFLALDPHQFIHPDDHHLFHRFMDEVFSGREFRGRARDIRKDGSSFHVDVLGTPVAYGGELHALAVVRDISEQVAAEEELRKAHDLLEQRVEERTRELTTLVEVARSVSSTLELRPLLATILDQLQTATGYVGASILLREGDTLVIAGTRGPAGVGAEQRAVGVRFPLARMMDFWELMQRGEASLVADVRGASEGARTYQRAVGDLMGTPAFSYVRSFMAVPLRWRDEAIGALTLSADEPDAYTEDDVRVARGIAAQAAAAIENARLYEQTQQRTRELGGLLQVAQSVASTLELREVSGAILDQLQGLVPYTSASVSILDGDTLGALESRGPLPLDWLERFRVPMATLGGYTAARDGRPPRREPVRIDDIWGDAPGAELFRSISRRAAEMAGLTLAPIQPLHSYLDVPLVAKERLVGLLTMLHERRAFYTDEHVRLARSVAAQAAIAVENARLYEQTQQRTRELTALLDVSHTVAATLDLRQIVALILDQLRTVLDYTGGSLMLVEGDEFVIIDSRGPQRGVPETKAIGMRWKIAEWPVWWERMQRGHGFIIRDVLDPDDPDARTYRRALGVHRREEAFVYVRNWAAVPLIARDRVVGMLSFSRNTPGYFNATHTQLARAVADQAAIAIENARLFEETQRRARELGALVDVAKGIASNLQQGPLVGSIIDSLKMLVPHQAASVLLRDGDTLRVLSYDPDAPYRPRSPEVRLPLAPMRQLWAVVERGEALRVDDVRSDDDPRALALRRGAGGLMATALSYMRGFLAVPLRLGERTIGVLALGSSEPASFTDEHATIARAVADQAAVALENARLFEETQRRARETEALLRADAELFRSLNIEDVFQALCDVAVDVLEVDECMVSTVDDDEGHYTARASRNIPPETLAMIADIRQRSPRRALAVLDRTVVYDDPAAAIPEMREVFERDGIRMRVDVPIRSPSGLHGVFGLAYHETHEFSDRDRRLFEALAERAAVALDNAALYERAGQAASLEERQRLARELHDSVSQALYGIALGARTARTQLDRDPARVAEPLDYVLSLAEAGLTEMRALIFELRPESLETEGLVAAIQKQVAATQARFGIQVEASMAAEPDAPPAVKEAVYRITQEALHNVVKHAHATQASVRLSAGDGVVRVEVRDNGAGFDAGGSFPGHIGLRSMRERAAKLRGTLSIESAPGAGTRVIAELPLDGAATRPR